jgi:hypothetical protein
MDGYGGLRRESGLPTIESGLGFLGCHTGCVLNRCVKAYGLMSSVFPSCSFWFRT